VKVSFAREPLSFQRNPEDGFCLRGGERERLLFRGGEGGILAMCCCVVEGKEREERLGSYCVGHRAWRGRVVLRYATLFARA
jgi:hypothetical protein